jgi:transcriptional regulator with XRE-family HTH domain
MASLHSPRYRQFLERLRAARLAAGLTQAEVASALGKPQSFVSKSENGERRVDAIEFADLASLYGVAMEALAAAGRRGGRSGSQHT